MSEVKGYNPDLEELKNAASAEAAQVEPMSGLPVAETNASPPDDVHLETPISFPSFAKEFSKETPFKDDSVESEKPSESRLLSPQASSSEDTPTPGLVEVPTPEPAVAEAPKETPAEIKARESKEQDERLARKENENRAAQRKKARQLVLKYGLGTDMQSVRQQAQLPADATEDQIFNACLEIILQKGLITNRPSLREKLGMPQTATEEEVFQAGLAATAELLVTLDALVRKEKMELVEDEKQTAKQEPVNGVREKVMRQVYTSSKPTDQELSDEALKDLVQSIAVRVKDSFEAFTNDRKDRRDTERKQRQTETKLFYKKVNELAVNGTLPELKVLLRDIASHGGTFKDDFTLFLSVEQDLRDGKDVTDKIKQFQTVDVPAAVTAILDRQKNRHKVEDEKVFNTFKDALNGANSYEGLLEILAKYASAVNDKMRTGAESYLKVIQDLQNEISKATAEEMKTKFSRAGIEMRLKAILEVPAATLLVVQKLESQKATLVEEQKITEYVNKLTNTSNISACIDILTQGQAESRKIGEAVLILKNVKTVVELGKDEFYRMTPDRYRNFKMGDLSVQINRITNPALKVKVSEIAYEHAQAEQEVWKKAIETQRDNLKITLADKLEKVMPEHIRRIYTKNPVLKEVLGETQFEHMISAISEEMVSFSESQTNGLDFSLFSGNDLSRDAQFIKDDTRLMTAEERKGEEQPAFNYDAKEQEGHTNSYYGSKISSKVYEVLNKLEKNIRSNSKLLSESIAFADKDASSFSKDFFLRTFKNSSYDQPNRNEKNDDFVMRKIETVKDTIVQTVFQRLMLAQATETSNPFVFARKEKAKALNIMPGAFMDVPDPYIANKSIMDTANSLAVDYLTNTLGYQPELVAEYMKDLSMPPAKETLTKVADLLLKNAGGKIELIPDNVIVPPTNHKDGEKNWMRRRDFFTSYDSDTHLGSAYLWKKKNNDGRPNNDILSDESKRNAADRLINSTNITRKITTQPADTVNYLGSRLSRVNLTTADTSSAWFTIKAGDYLTPDQRQDIRDFAATSESTEDVTFFIEDLLRKSSELQGLTEKINMFTAELVEKSVKDPDQFLLDVGITTDKSLTAADWLSVFMTAAIGKVSNKSVAAPYLVNTRDRVLTEADLQKVLEFGQGRKNSNVIA